jgi:hypothetical protein
MKGAWPENGSRVGRHEKNRKRKDKGEDGVRNISDKTGNAGSDKSWDTLIGSEVQPVH